LRSEIEMLKTRNCDLKYYVKQKWNIIKYEISNKVK